jgi:hypothetical protein
VLDVGLLELRYLHGFATQHPIRDLQEMLGRDQAGHQDIIGPLGIHL